jgi:hypothetical protein
MTSIYQIIRKLKIMCCIVYEMQSMIHCADISHGFANGGLHPTASPHPTGTGIVNRMSHSHDRWKYISQVVLGHDWPKNHLKAGLATKGIRLGMLMTLGHPY